MELKANFVEILYPRLKSVYEDYIKAIDRCLGSKCGLKSRAKKGSRAKKKG